MSLLRFTGLSRLPTCFPNNKQNHLLPGSCPWGAGCGFSAGLECLSTVPFGPRSALQEGAELFFAIVGHSFSHFLNFVHTVFGFLPGHVSRTCTKIVDSYSSVSLPQASVHREDVSPTVTGYSLWKYDFLCSLMNMYICESHIGSEVEWNLQRVDPVFLDLLTVTGKT